MVGGDGVMDGPRGAHATARNGGKGGCDVAGSDSADPRTLAQSGGRICLLANAENSEARGASRGCTDVWCRLGASVREDRLVWRPGSSAILPLLARLGRASVRTRIRRLLRPSSLCVVRLS